MEPGQTDACWAPDPDPQDVVLPVHFDLVVAPVLDLVHLALRLAQEKGDHFQTWQLEQKAKILAWQAGLTKDQQLHQDTVAREDPELLMPN